MERLQSLLWLLANIAMTGSRDRAQTLDLLCQACAGIHRLEPTLPVLTADRLEASLQVPVEEWLPDTIRGELTGALLVSSVVPSRICREMHLEYEAREQMDRTQALILRIRDFCKVLPDGQTLYRTFRRFLIQSPTTQRRPARLIFQPLDVSLDDMYRAPKRHELLGTYLYLCPCCGWAMNVTQPEVACTSQWCEQAGSLFDRQHDQVVRRSNGAVLAGVAAEDILVLQDTFWKFTLLPGLLELQLAEGLQNLGFTPVLWPDFDESDVRIELDGEYLDLDAKVWRYPDVLASHLSALPRSKLRWIVIPDYQATSLPFLREKTGLQIHTYSSCLKELKKRA
ncbi:restriction endonuclease-related protein [Pseudomonas sp. GM48]|uniref:restriction endonuclease-related protein n=1 Tax=Pseudomonas sp. GM48 TaxID=1144330 RepID=UPI00026FDDC0|nr:hypothetical protein [Pseudomonas sp. GM48]EJM56181.1 hypothetical protein PMI28_03162 [Pseudomonas sp. GM48]